MPSEAQKEKKEEKIRTELVVCPACRGNGFLENGDSCRQCKSRGVFLRVGNCREYYWGKNLSGYFRPVRSAYVFFENSARYVAFLCVFVALLFGIGFVVANNADFFATLKDNISAAVQDEENVFAAAVYSFSIILQSTISAFGVILDKTGFGSFMFWSGILGACYFYYFSKAGNSSQKELDILSSEFEVFYKNGIGKNSPPVDISLYASPSSLLAFEKALDFAYGKGQAPVVLHLARVLIEDADVRSLLKRLEIDWENFKNYLDGKIDDLPKSDFYNRKGIWKETVMSPEMKKIAILALEEGLVSGFEMIGSEALFLALLYDEVMDKYFHDLKLERNDIRSAALWASRWNGHRAVSVRPRKIRHTVMNKAWTARVTPELDRFSYDMTDYARCGLTGAVVNRTRELDNLMRILERTSKNNALLIGEEGSGRTTIVKALANRMIHDEVLPTLRDKRLVVLDIGALVAGARAGGDLEVRIRKVLEDMGKSGNIILYIPNIHNMAAAGSGGEFDVSKAFAPILSQGLFQIIGSTDYRNYRRYIEPRADFANGFDLVKVEELSEEDSLKALAIQAGMIEAREGIIMTYGGVKKAVELSKRYIPDRLLPGKAIDLLSETAVEVRRRGAGSVLRDEDVTEIITEKTGIPLTSINSTEAERLLNLEESLHRRVIGQEQAIKAVASAIRRVRVGMKIQNRPIGTFLFLGPTGVGKTELAKALAEVYYGDENAMIRLDMSEYQTVGSVEKLIGVSGVADVQGGDGGGIITEAVKHRPFSLILLDELEKANKNVLNVFLQVFDDGRLTDNLGRTVDFTNTIIIATSNAGSQVVSKMFVDENTDNARIFDLMEPYLLQYFAPEFLNRFTDKIIFRSLTMKDLSAIAKLQIRSLAQRLDKAQGIKIEVDAEAEAYLVSAGYSAQYGARYLQRTMQEKLENLIAVEFLKGNIKRGDTFRVAASDLKNL